MIERLDKRHADSVLPTDVTVRSACDSILRRRSRSRNREMGKVLPTREEGFIQPGVEATSGGSAHEGPMYG